MGKIRKFLNIEHGYKYETNDLRALTMIVNLLLIITVGFASSWFGFSLAVLGLIKDCKNPNRHINDFLMHGASLIMNIYFLSLLYRG
jgi:hypothetical protein